MARSTNNHLYPAIRLCNNAITNCRFLFFTKTVRDQQAKTNDSLPSQFLPLVYLLDFPRPSGKPFSNRSKHEALYLNRLLLFTDGPVCPIFRLDSRVPRIREFIRKYGGGKINLFGQSQVVTFPSSFFEFGCNLSLFLSLVSPNFRT